MYGVNQYVFKYEREIGRPWETTKVAMKYSYAFFHAANIRTPTLFMGGDQDFNVPLIGGEQMYQALRSLNVPTQLVVYPGEHHGLSRTSFIRDRYQRYLAWYDHYLTPTSKDTDESFMQWVRSSFIRVWGWPLVLAVLSLFGLLSALLGQGGVWWVLSWIALVVPLGVIVWCLTRDA